MTYITAYSTDEGIAKQINQDALCIKTASFRSEQIIMAAVCDGMGGLSDGETASAYIIDCLSRWFETSFADLMKSGAKLLDIRQNLDKYLHSNNDKLNDYAQTNNKILGTTMTAVFIIPTLGKMLAAHVGDSRLYRITDSGISLLTADHSVVGDEIRKGNLTEEMAGSDSRQNQLTKCMGAGLANVSYDYLISEYETQCCYMLCSDGFRKKITSDELFTSLRPDKITSDSDATQILESLTQLNMSRNETDNITALLIKTIS
ncbi:MAG: serine/threonine-protein phosphatase [Oscillospiraceae bacterium]|nr:serine/threonine-protein phosphatase [Oscillospiraceae bacterium]